MRPEILEAKMRKLEYFHNLKVLPETWTVLRLDGRSFSRLTEKWEKPFDITFHNVMVEVSKKLLEEFGGIFCYTESDEISLLLPMCFDMFDREVEKLVSISASLASSVFTQQTLKVVQFDSRVCVIPNDQSLLDYFSWRQADSTKNALNSYAYWKLRQSGMSAGAATHRLSKATVAEKNELLFQLGVNFNDTPLWQRRGTGMYFETYEKTGWNPQKQVDVKVERRRIKVDTELPMKDEYRCKIAALCGIYWYLEHPDRFDGGYDSDENTSDN